MIDDKKIKVRGLHSVEMQDDELRAMVDGGSHLTMRALMSLHLAGSPYIRGGSLTEGDVLFAAGAIGLEGGMPELHDAIAKEISTAMRIYEILVPDETGRPRKSSEIRIFGPEWLADQVSMAAKALPSLTWEGALDMPLAALLHLGMAAARANGQITERPHGIMEALKQLEDLKHG